MITHPLVITHPHIHLFPHTLGYPPFSLPLTPLPLLPPHTYPLIFLSLSLPPPPSFFAGNNGCPCALTPRRVYIKGGGSSKGSTLSSRTLSKTDQHRDSRKGGSISGNNNNGNNTNKMKSSSSSFSSSTFSTSNNTAKGMILQVAAARHSTLVLCRADPDANMTSYHLHYPHAINEVNEAS